MRESLQLCALVARRNWIVYKRDLVANLSPSVVDPLFFICSLGLGLGSFIPGIEGRSYLRFLAPGLAMSTAMFTSFFETSYGFYVRLTYESVYKAMLTTRVGPNEVLAGEFLWVGLKGAVMSLGVTLVFAVFGAVSDLRLAPVVMCAGVLVALNMGAVGLLASAWARNINQFQVVYSFVVAPLFFFSGIFFPLDRLPRAAQWAALALPLAHGVKLSHAAYWNEGVARALAVHGGAMLLQAAVLGGLAWRAIARKLRS